MKGYLRGGGVRKVPKKCHILFELPLKSDTKGFKNYQWSCTHDSSSLFGEVKLFQLSEKKSFGNPLMFTNCENVFMTLPVLWPRVASRCTTCVCKQVKTRM